MTDRDEPADAPLAIVIPTLDEAGSLPLLLGDLAGLATLGVRAELIVVDGGSRDDTTEIAARAGARVVLVARGRGRQLAAGASVARAPLLCFLHADVRLGSDALHALASLARGRAAPRDAYAFRLAIDAPGWRYRMVERAANLRSRLLSLPYGDQGLVLSRAAYDAAGGYPSVPLMEDVAIVRALGAIGRVHLLSAAVRVSARRWRRDGVARRSARNLLLLVRYLCGASPDALALSYERSRPAAESRA